MIAALLKVGADVAVAHPEGQTSLMAAARTGSLDAVKSLLLDAGAMVNAADSYQQQTALMWASSEGHLDVVDALLAAGADQIARLMSRRSTSGSTPITRPAASRR